MRPSFYQPVFAMIGLALSLLVLMLGALMATTVAHAQGSKTSAAVRQSVGTLVFTNSPETPAGAFQLTLTQVAAPPAGSHYELWLHAEQTPTLDLGKVTFANGQGHLQGNTAHNLLLYDRVSISLQSDKAKTAEISDQIVLTATRPLTLQQALAQLLVLIADPEPEAGASSGYLTAAQQQTGIAVQHTGFLRNALGETDLPQARRHAEHIINVLDGKNGFMYGDLDRNGRTENPGDGFGVRAYLDKGHESALDLVELIEYDPALQATSEQAEAIVSALEVGQAAVSSSFDNALQIFASDTVTEALAHAQDLTAVTEGLLQQVHSAYQLSLQLTTFTFDAPAGVPPTPTKTSTRTPTDTPTPRPATPTHTPSPTPVAATATTTQTLTLQPTATVAAVLTSTTPVAITATTTTTDQQPPLGPVLAGVQLSLTVGTSWRNPADGSLYLYVSGGEFTMGSTADTAASPREEPQHPVTVGEFWLQQTETTNGQYARCVSAGVCTPPSNERWSDPAYLNHPVTDVDWVQATTYAAWVGGRLPTEAEWEKACRDTDARAFPWGDEAPDETRSNYNNNVGDTTPVGSYPAGASPLGIVDLSGNVWEWVSSLDADYPYNATDGREEATAAGKRVVRGGSFYYTQYQIRCVARTGFTPDTTSQHTGFRVVIDKPITEWRHNVDQALYVYVPGGAFMMGSTPDTAASPREEPQHTVTIDGFWLQQTETTNEQYARCVAAKGCTPPANERWDDAAYAQHPVTDVNWEQANAYAAWVGGRLPTEAEWENACRGDDARAFPWGAADPTDLSANFGNTVGDTTVVGSYPDGASPVGALDLSGNVWEWVSSLDADYPYNATDGRETATEPGKRIVRGGSFNYTKYQIRCAARTGFAPDTALPYLGLRVALDAPQ